MISDQKKDKGKRYLKDNSLDIKSYKNDAYGRLSWMYDLTKSKGLSQMNEVEKNLFSIDLENLENDIVDYSKTQPLKNYQTKNIINRLKFIYAAYNDVNALKDDEKNKLELNDAFDFELDPTQKLNEKLLTENAENRILAAIKEAKTQTVTNSTANRSQDENYYRSTNKHPDYNPNYFNENGYRLFKYLFDEYVLNNNNKGEKARLTSIWHFFNNDLKNNTIFKKSKSLTKVEFVKFAKENYSIEIKNMDKKAAYDNKHQPTLNDHLDSFKQNYEIMSTSI